MGQDRASSAETFERLSDVRLQTLKLVETLDQDQACYASAPKEWSVVEILDHLVLTDATFRAQLDRLFEIVDEGGSCELRIGFNDLDSAPSMIPGAVLPLIEEPLRWMNRMMPSSVRETLIERPVVAFRSSSATRPDGDRSIDDLRVHLATSIEETLSLVGARDDLEQLFIDHPMFGRNSTLELLGLQWRHEVRHQKQIRDLLRHSSFPGPGKTAPGREPEVSFAALERDVDTALGDARQVLDWWHQKTAESSLELFDLQPAFAPYYEIQGFFDTIHLLGEQEPASIMGCLQRHRFQRRKAAVSGLPKHLESFLDEEFFERCTWKHADGQPGGFRYHGMCGREWSGEKVAIPSPLRLAELRERFEWAVLRVDILDFVRSHEYLGRFHDALSSVLRESAYIVLHDDLAKPPGRPPANVVGDYSFGYAFLPRSVEPSLFGFGPGRFGAAIKQWRFLLFKNGDVEIRVAFLVTPRSEQVMNIGGVDPVYGSIDLAHTMSLGSVDLRQSARDRIDTHFLAQHGNVHRDVVLGMREVWEAQRWVPRFDSW